MRESGILLPISSLPGKYGIGCFSEEAYRFVDQLVSTQQRCWQILPLGPTSYGDSPYQSFSTFAGNPYFICLEDLIAEGVLTREECDAVDFGEDPRSIDYAKLYEGRYPLLRKAYERSRIYENPEFVKFQQEQVSWLEDYALFMAVKGRMNQVSWDQWPEDIRKRWGYALDYYRRELYFDIEFYKYLQFKFYEQWNRLKAYANAHGIRIVGDIPIYVAYDSADAWANPELFQLDGENLPVAVAGCPPDGFAADGQLWGNPLYRWDYHVQTGYEWWMRRLSHCFEMYDVVRIDHFRGFDEYFSIPFGDTTAWNGHWEKGPGLELFQTMKARLGEKEVIAEDLGYVTDTVRQLVQDSGFPGMKVLEFAFDSRDTGSASDYLPHNYPVNSVVYTGTHDNETLIGWYQDINEEERTMLRKYLHNFHTPDDRIHWDIICLVMSSVARMCIIPMQDYLGLDNSCRINQPSTLGKNWKWRLLPGEFDESLMAQILDVTSVYGRRAWHSEEEKKTSLERRFQMNRTWWKEAVIYQIYPRSFMDSNGDGIGDLKGITSRLDYLKDLGIDVIWLSPIYQSPNDDNGYDISDYQAIMEEFGTMEDFDELLREAHARKLRIVMDLVVNHTSDEHQWFVESRKSLDNLYRDYYIWREPKADGSAPNNWGASFGGPAWEYDPRTGMYYLHLFSKKQPDLNWDNPKVRDAVFDMMTWWCEKGIDGFRMDVICMISKTKEMPDGEVHDLYGDFSPYALHGPNVHNYLREMNDRVLSGYDLMTVGETPAVTPELAIQYTGEDRRELNMVFEFEHVEGDGKYGKWTDEKVPLPRLKAIMSKWQTSLYGKAWNSLFWDNHDQPRAVSRFGDDRPQFREASAKMLATCLHMLQGSPYIYQGEELGMTNYPFESPEDFRDIESIQAYRDWVESGILSHEVFWPCMLRKSRDNARTPMQWNDREQAGFTTGTPWIGVNPNYLTINAEKEQKDPDSVFSYYKKLIAMRKEHLIMVYGRYELLLPEDENLWVYTRTLENEKWLVVCSFSDCSIPFAIPQEFEGGQCMISNISEASNISTRGTVILAPYEAFVLKRVS